MESFTVSDTRTSGKGSKVFSVTTIYNGTMSAVASGLVPATVTTSTIAKDARQCFDVTVPAGGQLLRFQTFASVELSMAWAYAALPVGAALGLVAVIAQFLDPVNEELETAQ